MVNSCDLSVRSLRLNCFYVNNVVMLFHSRRTKKQLVRIDQERWKILHPTAPPPSPQPVQTIFKEKKKQNPRYISEGRFCAKNMSTNINREEFKQNKLL